jgi:hypothetical protein
MDEEEKKPSLEEQLIKGKLPRLEGSTEFNTYLVTPVIPDIMKKGADEYHKFITKDFAVSWLSEKWIEAIGKKYLSLIFDFVFIGLPNMAKLYGAELNGNITLKRSIEGFEREKLTTVTVVKREPTGSGGELKKGGWFRK